MRNLTKVLLLVALAALVLVALAAPAFAGGYLRWTAVSALPGQGTSPHGGYSSSTVKCQVCHAVHYAQNGGQLLLQDTVANACNYCHVGGAGGYTQVYGGVPANAVGSNFANAHNFYNNGVSNVGVVCTSCHQVHAAASVMTSNSYLTSKILWTKPADPRLGLPRSTDSSALALTRWCAGCHFDIAGSPDFPQFNNGEYYNDTYADGSGLPGTSVSHVATLAHSTYGNPASTTTTKVAWGNSDLCQSCHSSQYGQSQWPHYTAGSRFLESALASGSARSAATTSAQDGICLGCHRMGGAGTLGIGINY